MLAAEEVGNVAERVERIIEFITLMILKEKLHFRSFIGPPPPEKFQCISFLVALLNGSLLLLSPFRYDEDCTSSQSVVRRTTRPPRTNQSLFTCCAVGRWSVCGHNNLWANNYDSVCVTRAASSSVSDYCGKRISQIVCCAPLV